jgi:hypothetical protein
MLGRILDAKPDKRDNEEKATTSFVKKKRARMSTEAEDGHFEQLLYV